MTTARTYLNQLFPDSAILSGQTTYGNLPFGQLSAAASYAASGTTLVMAQTVPSWIVASMPIWNITKNVASGTVTGSTSTTLSASASFGTASVGAADVLQFGFSPTDLSTGFSDGTDVRGMVEIARRNIDAAYAILSYLTTDVITSSADAAASTILTNAQNQL